MKETVKVGFVVNKELWEKFKKIAEYEVRSNSREVARAVRFYVENFEKQHGEIANEKPRIGEF